MSNNGLPKQQVDPLAAYIATNLHDAKDFVLTLFKAGWVPNLLSSPGIGKSSLIHQIAAELNYFVVDQRLSQMDPADLNGFPHIFNREDPTKARAGYVPMIDWPIVGDELPVKTWKQVVRDDVPQFDSEGQPVMEPDTYYAGWVVLLDEFNSGSMNMQAAAYKVVLDRMVGMHHLHEKVYIVTAGNLMSDKAITNRLGTATQSRLAHLPIRLCHQTWHTWADKANVDHRVTSFLRRWPEELHKFDPNHTDLTFGCPRTWHMMSDVIKVIKDPTTYHLPLLAGIVGVGPARLFQGFCAIYGDIPDMPAILADPLGIHIKDDASVHYALAGMVGAYMNQSNAEPSLKFLSRLGVDFQVTSIRKAISNDMALMQNAAVQNWLKVNTSELIQGRT